MHRMKILSGSHCDQMAIKKFSYVQHDLIKCERGQIPENNIYCMCT